MFALMMSSAYSQQKSLPIMKKKTEPPNQVQQKEEPKKAEQKKDKYLENSREHSKSLISDGVSPEEAISFATKVVIMENLLTKIAFPFSVWARIEYLNESDDYRKVFDQEKLNTIIESFRDKVSSLAKIVAITV